MDESSKSSNKHDNGSDPNESPRVRQIPITISDDGEQPTHPSPPVGKLQIVADRIMAVNLEVNNLLQLVRNFNKLTADCTDYRYIEEMLTRSILTLDQLECGQCPELRQKRKTTCRSIEQISDVLKKKLDLNIELDELSLKLGSQS